MEDFVVAEDSEGADLAEDLEVADLEVVGDLEVDIGVVEDLLEELVLRG